MCQLTDTAASDYEGQARFYSDEDFGMLECGGSILSPDVETNGKNPKNMAAN